MPLRNARRCAPTNLFARFSSVCADAQTALPTKTDIPVSPRQPDYDLPAASDSIPVLPQETGSQNNDGTVFLACTITHLICMYSKGRNMFNIGNLQLVGGVPRRESLLGAMDELHGAAVTARKPAARPLSLHRADSTSRLPAEALSEQRSLLNCMLNLSKLLAENAGNNLSPKQVDYAQTIYTAGTQLLSHIDRLALADVAGGGRPARSLAIQAYRGPRSRRSDDGFVLIAESDAAAAVVMLDLLQGSGYQAKVVTNLRELSQRVMHRKPDAIILGKAFSGRDGRQVLELLRHDPEARQLPVSISNLAAAMREDGMAHPEQTVDGVLDETLRFLHKVVGERQSAPRQTSSGRRQSMPELSGKKVLIVDDDILNIYAMTGVLEQQGMIVMHADDGQAGLEMLRTQADMDAVIVNSGMQAPGSHELVGAIRSIPAFESLPIIAVTSDDAQADRGQCVKSGASDYIDKPINIEQLLSLMRAWLSRAR